jgi:hypothetical protein
MKFLRSHRLYYTSIDAPEGDSIVPSLSGQGNSSQASATSKTSLPTARWNIRRIIRRALSSRQVSVCCGPHETTGRRVARGVARAHQWSDDLLSGRARPIAEIAERKRVGARYIRRMMRLAFLAPKIVEMIAAGNQPPDMPYSYVRQFHSLSMVRCCLPAGAE